jgi:hypothetical protein
MSKAISKKNLADAFRIIASAKIPASRMLVDEQTWKDLAFVPCESCGGMRHPDHPHSPEDCDLQRVRSVMED